MTCGELLLHHSILSGMLDWVESPFTPIDPEVVDQMKAFAGTIDNSRFSAHSVRVKVRAILAALDQKVRDSVPRCPAYTKHALQAQQLSCIVIPHQHPVDLSNLIQLDSWEIAATLTAIEGFAYRCLHPADFVAYLRDVDGPGMNRVADVCLLVDGVTYWVVREVLQHDQAELRGRNLKKFVAVANVSLLHLDAPAIFTCHDLEIGMLETQELRISQDHSTRSRFADFARSDRNIRRAQCHRVRAAD